MSKAAYPLKLPNSIKQAAQRLAKEDGVSLNQWIATAVAQKVGAVETAAEFFRKRATRASGGGLMSFLINAPDLPETDASECMTAAPAHKAEAKRSASSTAGQMAQIGPEAAATTSKGHPTVVMKIDYRSTNPDAGVVNYEMLADGIILEFGDQEYRYLYNSQKPGAEHVENMKRLAVAGDGLTTYVNQHVRENYAAKLPLED
jgi:hypothetical protein